MPLNLTSLFSLNMFIAYPSDSPPPNNIYTIMIVTLARNETYWVQENWNATYRLLSYKSYNINCTSFKITCLSTLKLTSNSRFSLHLPKIYRPLVYLQIRCNLKFKWWHQIIRKASAMFETVSENYFFVFLFCENKKTVWLIVFKNCF